MRVSDTERALLTAVAAAPDEDTPRLAYADFLDERGDTPASDRASLIRLQVRAERDLSARSGWDRVDEEHRRFWAEMDRRKYGYQPPTVRVGRRKLTPVPPTAFDRAQELLARYEEPWAEPFDQWLRRFSDAGMEAAYLNFRRGFLHRFTMRVDGFRKFAARLFTMAPVVELWFPEEGDRYGRLADRRELARVRALDLRSHMATPGAEDGMEELLRSPHLAGLKCLTTHGPSESGSEPSGLRALLGPHHLANLETLHLDSHVQDEFLRALAASAQLPGLTALLVPQATIRPETAAALADSPGLKSLQLLDLSDAQVTPRARRRLEERFGAGVRFRKKR
jgi:uncharacterized protein (TIGR02996 family)